MKLRGIFESIPFQLLQGSLETEVTDIAFDSRKVTAGTMFVCIPGFRVDGHQFGQVAAEQGASVIIVERAVPEIPAEVTVIQVENTRQALPMLASAFFSHPTQQAHVVGITGTNGKTSVSYLISEVLKNNNRLVGVIGTIGYRIGNQGIPLEKTTPTTPEAVDLQRLFRLMVDQGAEDIVMEVSSMALKLRRVDACRFQVGVFTNLSQDHLDDHGTMEDYKASKLMLFDRCEESVVNIDDPFSSEVLKKSVGRVKTYGIDHQEADVMAKDIEIHADGVRFLLCYQGEEQQVNLRIPGRFSVYNALAAAGACISLGLTLNQIANGLAQVRTIAGRFETIHSSEGFSVIVDYAHSPDALENVIQTVREFAKGRVITLFGCGGDRDPSKRVMMGRIAGHLSDHCILTSDNPRSEDPLAILEEIEKGARETGCTYDKYVDRKEAIHAAIDMARPQDVVIVAGKGHEDYQEIQGKKIHFDDAEVIRSYLSS